MHYLEPLLTLMLHKNPSKFIDKSRKKPYFSHSVNKSTFLTPDKKLLSQFPIVQSHEYWIYQRVKPNTSSTKPQIPVTKIFSAFGGWKFILSNRENTEKGKQKTLQFFAPVKLTENWDMWRFWSSVFEDLWKWSLIFSVRLHFTALNNGHLIECCACGLYFVFQ